MRYLRQQVLNRRSPTDFSVKVDMTDGVIMDTTNNLLMPKGTTAQRPVAPVNGMLRYNTTTDQVEVRQNNAWRSLRFKESTGITQQTLGPGNDLERHFGPLNPAPPTLVEKHQPPVWSFYQGTPPYGYWRLPWVTLSGPLTNDSPTFF